MMEILLSLLLALTPLPEDYTSDSQVVPIPEWDYVGTCRVTEYCDQCNCPAGYGSASGKVLEYGDCACSWLALGSQLLIDGEVFTVVDVCGTDAIDIFIPSDGTCRCDRNEYVDVYILCEP